MRTGCMGWKSMQRPNAARPCTLQPVHLPHHHRWHWSGTHLDQQARQAGGRAVGRLRLPLAAEQRDEVALQQRPQLAARLAKQHRQEPAGHSACMPACQRQGATEQNGILKASDRLMCAFGWQPLKTKFVMRLLPQLEKPASGPRVAARFHCSPLRRRRL